MSSIATFTRWMFCVLFFANHMAKNNFCLYHFVFIYVSFDFFYFAFPLSHTHARIILLVRDHRNNGTFSRKSNVWIETNYSDYSNWRINWYKITFCECRILSEKNKWTKRKWKKGNIILYLEIFAYHVLSLICRNKVNCMCPFASQWNQAAINCFYSHFE